MFIKRFIYMLTLILTVSSCKDDILPEMTDLQVSRLFSPVDLQAQIMNQTAVRLTWKAVDQADTYTIQFFLNEDADFSGEPVKTVSDITFDQVPYTVPGFDGETEYAVRVQAVGQQITESKWVSTTFKTDPEQIFQEINPDELTATQVTLHWPAGETATEIRITPGNIVHSLSAAEITAGEATLTELMSETAYVAKLMNGNKTRGTMAFTTLIDLGDAIPVYPEDDLTSILEGAQDGDVFALLPGEYPTQDITISKTIAIKGAKPADQPVLKGTILRIKDGAGLELSHLILDGTDSKDGNQTLIYDMDLPAGTYGALSVENCSISNYGKGVLYVNKKSLIESVTFKGNTISNIVGNGGDGIDFRNGLAKTFTFTNNTVYNSTKDRDFFRMDAGGSTNFPGQNSVITITNNTFNEVCSGSSSRRMLYIRLAMHQITFSKNIVANMQGIYTNQSSTNIVTMSKNNYFNAANLAENDPFDDFTTLDPGFKDASQGDFTVSNLDLKLAGIGDPRWLQ